MFRLRVYAKPNPDGSHRSIGRFYATKAAAEAAVPEALVAFPGARCEIDYKP